MKAGYPPVSLILLHKKIKPSLMGIKEGHSNLILFVIGTETRYTSKREINSSY
jgi:hypothetical protein